MTVDEAWGIVTTATEAGDWTGVLAGADALAEVGLEAQAVAVRWAVRRQVVPVNHYTDPSTEEKWWSVSWFNLPTCMPRPDWEGYNTQRTVWGQIVFFYVEVSEFFK